LAQRVQLRRRFARVDHRHLRARCGAPARHCEAGGTATEDEDVLVLHVHRNFNVERPTRHSSIVMIQKRITTCVSFQPVFSKWWCSGAISRMRRPVTYLRLVYLKYITCTITDSASTTKMPPMMASTISWRTITAMVPSAPPRASAPTSPMNTCAGCALNHRKASPAPATAEQKISSSPEPGM